MTLSEARIYLSPYIENGRCSNTEIARIIINEAQRRLYSMGNWIGLIRRWGTTVDTNGEFNKPAACEDIMRIAELPTGLPFSVGGSTVSSDTNAFVFDSPSLLAFANLTPNRYKVLGPYPPAVDVMGKVRYVDASNETDNLIVNDKDALKLMCLGIHKENSNAPEQANELIQKAVAHLTMRTELAKQNAKMALHQNLLATCKPGTRGYNRAKAALGISGGEREDDGRIVEILGDAEKKLLDLTQHYHVYNVTARQGIFHLPHTISKILKVDVNGIPAKLGGFMEEFVRTGVGYRDSNKSSQTWVPRGEHAAPDITTAGVVTASFTGACRDVNLVLEGEDSDSNYQREILKVSGGIATSGTKTWTKLTSITADPRDGAMTVSIGDQEMAKLQPYEMDSKRARYYFPGCGTDTEVELQVLGRARWVPKIRDEQRMQVESDIAINYMVISIVADRAGELEKSIAFEKRALDHLETTRRNESAGETNPIDHGKTHWRLSNVVGKR